MNKEETIKKLKVSILHLQKMHFDDRKAITTLREKKHFQKRRLLRQLQFQLIENHQLKSELDESNRMIDIYLKKDYLRSPTCG